MAFPQVILVSFSWASNFGEKAGKIRAGNTQSGHHSSNGRFVLLCAGGTTHSVTLIVSTLAGNYPVLFGDLLISVKATPTKYQITLPIQDVEHVGDDYAITALAQKVCLVTPNLAVGWSGSKIVAQTIILEMLQSFTSRRPVTFDELAKFFHDLNFPEANTVQMVGLILEEKNRVSAFGWNAKTHQSLLLDKIWFAGSGSDHLLQVLQNMSSLITRGNPPDYATALGKVLLIACSVLGEEMYTRANLASFYGGGLEIVYFNQGKFEKLGDITYVFWEVAVISPEELKFGAQVAVKFSYTKDILLIHRIDLRDVSPRERLVLFIVGPIHRNLDKTEIEELKGTTMPDLNSGFLCHYFSINHPDGTPDHPNLVVVDKGQPDMFKFINEGNKIVVAVHNNFAERLMKSIRERVTTRG